VRVSTPTLTLLEWDRMRTDKIAVFATAYQVDVISFSPCAATAENCARDQALRSS
jgi:hypothetical protein